ncbi:MAG: hypothetical protein AAGA23_09370 [Pseudomonadota bacterium]
MEPRVVSLATATPQQERPARDSRFASRRTFDHWLESLPLANVSAAGNELLMGVQELNHSRVSPRFRLHALEQLTEPCLAVVNVLDKNYQDAVFPLNAKVHKTGRTVIHFFRELAMGYRLSAHQFANESSRLSMVSRRPGALCVHRALTCCEQLLYRSGQLFRPLPVGMWNEIHTLFAFAVQNNLQDKALTDTLGWQKKQHRIYDIYKRICLLGLCDLQRLSQRAIQQVYKACETWRERTEVILGPAAEGNFAIEVDSDLPPQLRMNADQPAGDMSFDLDELKTWLEKLVSAECQTAKDIPLKLNNNETLILDGMLLRQLTATWGRRVERRSQRMPADHRARVVIGINGIHFMAAGEQSFSQFLEETGNERFVQQAGQANNWIAGSDQRFRPPVHEAEILNQSLGGYRLKFSKPENMQVRVGELVAISTTAISERDAIWMVAAVRWLQAPSPEEIELGLSVVGQDFRAAAVMAQVPGRKIPPARALLARGFSQDDADNHYLIVPPFHTEVGAPWLVAWREDLQMQEAMSRIEGLADRTTEFCRYTYASEPVHIDGVPDIEPISDSEIPPLDLG